MPEIVFLTRDGCVNTEHMLVNLKKAIQGDKRVLTIEMLDLGDLPATDPRTGFGTPTILVNGRDLLGMPEPDPPYGTPT